MTQYIESTPSLVRATLSFALELLRTADAAEVDTNGETVIDILLMCSRMDHPVIREGAAYGMEGFLDVPDIKSRLEEMAREDPSVGVRIAAAEAIEVVPSPPGPPSMTPK